MERKTIFFMLFLSMFALILIWACLSYKPNQRELGQSERDYERSQRVSRVRNPERPLRIDHVTFGSLNERQYRLPERNSPAPVHQFVQPTAPIETTASSPDWRFTANLWWMHKPIDHEQSSLNNFNCLFLYDWDGKLIWFSTVFKLSWSNWDADNISAINKQNVRSKIRFS
jgi:hypothetical protein